MQNAGIKIKSMTRTVYTKPKMILYIISHLNVYLSHVTFSFFYPPGSKSEALRLGVHLILLYFIRISLLSAETFFLFWCGWRTFFVFKSLDNNMVYSLGIGIYAFEYKMNLCITKVLWVLKFGEVGDLTNSN